MLSSNSVSSKLPDEVLFSGVKTTVELAKGANEESENINSAKSKLREGANEKPENSNSTKSKLREAITGDPNVSIRSYLFAGIIDPPQVHTETDNGFNSRESIAKISAGDSFTLLFPISAHTHLLSTVQWSWDLEKSLTGLHKHVEFRAEFLPAQLAREEARKIIKQRQSVFSYFGMDKESSSLESVSCSQTADEQTKCGMDPSQEQRGGGPQLEVVAQTRHGTEDGTCCGSFQPIKPGLVRLRWDNLASMVRSKDIRYRVEPVPFVGGPDDILRLLS